jgi:hypothetical protein
MAQRFGINVGGKSVSLGAPWRFSGYTNGSFLGRADAVRKQVLQTTKRLHDQSQEIELARAGRREPKLPDISARQLMAKKDRETLSALRKQWADLEAQVFKLELTLKPFDDTDTSFKSAVVAAQLRDRLFQAKDDRARSELLKLAPYRAALYEAPAETSGVSPLVYARSRQADIEARHPEETATIRDFRAAEQIIDSVFQATESALAAELLASGVVQQEQPEPQPQASEAWA